MIQIESIRHAFPEAAGFCIDRPYGHSLYTFLHFFEGIQLKIGKKEYETHTQACIIYAPGTPQYFFSRRPLIHNWFHFKGSPPLDMIQTDTLYYPKNGSFITEIVQEMETELAAGHRYSDVLLDLKAQELFVKLARSVAAAGSPSLIDATTAECFSHLRNEVFSNLGADWSVEQMAHRVNLSRSRFFEAYKQLYGISPVEDLICAKIYAAKNLLAFSNQPVKEIAESLGYRNITHFTRQFHERVGETPGGYRALQQCGERLSH